MLVLNSRTRWILTRHKVVFSDCPRNITATAAERTSPEPHGSRKPTPSEIRQLLSTRKGHA